MNLYIDDDSTHAVLVKFLRQEHDVQVPIEVGLSGAQDPVHFRHAIRAGRVLVSRNYKDFERLHELVMEAGGHHPGVVVIRMDNDASRDLSPRGIATAMGRLAHGGSPLPIPTIS